MMMDAFQFMAAQLDAARTPSTRAQHRKPGAGRPRSRPQQVYDQVRQMAAIGMSDSAIARAVGMSRAGIKKIRLAGQVQAAPKYNEADAQRLFDLVAGGMTVADAADQVMIPARTAVGLVRHRFGGARELRRSRMNGNDGE